MNLHTIPGFTNLYWMSFDDPLDCPHLPIHRSREICGRITLGVPAGTAIAYCDCNTCYETNRIDGAVIDHWMQTSDMVSHICEPCRAQNHPRPPINPDQHLTPHQGIEFEDEQDPDFEDTDEEGNPL